MRFDEFYSDVEYIFGEDIELEMVEDAYSMAKKHGISVLSDKDIYCVAVESDEVIGALWTAWSSSEYSFDVVVREDFQGRGIGNKLVDIAIQTYNEDKEAYDDSVMKAYVINKKVLVPLLLRKGFKIEKEYPEQIVMVKK